MNLSPLSYALRKYYGGGDGDEFADTVRSFLLDNGVPHEEVDSDDETSSESFASSVRKRKTPNSVDNTSQDTNKQYNEQDNTANYHKKPKVMSSDTLFISHSTWNSNSKPFVSYGVTNIQVN